MGPTDTRPQGPEEWLDAKRRPNGGRARKGNCDAFRVARFHEAPVIETRRVPNDDDRPDGLGEPTKDKNSYARDPERAPALTSHSMASSPA